jgi:hypothetical protein
LVQHGRRHWGCEYPSRPLPFPPIHGSSGNVEIKIPFKSEVPSAEAYAKARAERRDLRALKSEMSAEIDRLKSIEASTTWRVTLPLHKLGAHLPMGTRRVLSLGGKLGWSVLTFQLPQRIRRYITRRLVAR